MEALDHPVSRYAADVLEGKIIAGELVRLACERHFRDLETGADRGLVFDCQAASRILNFAGVIHHTKGEMAGKPLTLQAWQQFRHGSIFGWKKPKEFTDPVTGEVQTKLVRRFQSTYHQIAKKNGKTTDTAVPALYTQAFDGEQTPEMYCAATTRDQAGLLFQDLRRMVQKSVLNNQVMKVWRYHIETIPTGGVIKCLSRDGNATDGINPSFAARDEVHRWTDRELAEILVNSMIARPQPIDWAITTAGADRATICGEMRKYAEDVLRGDVQDDTFFGYVAEPPEDADPGDPRTWAMANPNMGIAFGEEALRTLYNKARAIPGQMPNFRRLHLNLWTEGVQSWIGRDTWDKGAAPFDHSDLYGRKAWVALDLSRSVDMSGLTIAVPVEDQIFVIVYSFLPCGEKGFIARAQSENRSFIDWRDRGYLEPHGVTIDQNEVFKRLLWIREHFDLQELSYDEWGMKDLAQKLDEARFPLVPFPQDIKKMSAASKEFENLAVNARIRHGGNPVLTWALGNAVLYVDANNNIKPHKGRSNGRIDPLISTIMAVHRASVSEKKRKAREIMFV